MEDEVVDFEAEFGGEGEVRVGGFLRGVGL